MTLKGASRCDCYRVVLTSSASHTYTALARPGMTDWTALPPPSFQKDSNAPASALSLPVGAVSERLVGRKVRVYGRVVSVSSLLF